MAVHDKINSYSKSYISDKNEKKRVFYKGKIADYHDGAMNFVKKIIERGIDDSRIYTKYVKGIIIDIYSAYAHIFIYEKNMNQLKAAIINFDNIKKN